MSSNTENIPPQVIKRVLKEISDILGSTGGHGVSVTSHQSSLEGITLIQNETDVCDIQAFIEGPQSTPYQGGLFRVKLVLCKGFPSQPPKAYFMTKIFHPNVASTGEICVDTLKKDWTPDLGIRHILLTVKCLLIVPNPESALNEEAGKLLLENYDEYFARAKLYTEVHARHSAASLLHKSSSSHFDIATTSGASSSSSSSNGASCSSFSTTNPLDASKTMHQNTTSNTLMSSSSDEPNSKMAKLQSSSTTAVASKKNDKKKALKRL
jgi:ubiquitin-conjugating enzyme E2 S